MSRPVLRSTFLPALSLCAAALLSPSVASAQTKIGVINFQRALLGTEEMKKASAELLAKYKPKQDQLEKLQKELTEIQTKLQDPKFAAQGPDLQADGQRKQREAQRITEDVQGEAEKDRQDILQRGSQRLTDVVKKLAEDKGLDVVVDTTNAVFFKPALEITEEAIAAYDRTFPAK